jgi:hypothetical protein
LTAAGVPFVSLSVAVVVFAVADLGSSRVDLLVVVVAVAGFQRVVLGLRAVQGVARRDTSVAVAVEVVEVLGARAAAEGEAEKALATRITLRRAVAVARGSPLALAQRAR